jgi:hypothetical protein
MFRRSYYAQYWNKATPGFKHSTLCSDAHELKRIIGIHSNTKDGRQFAWEVWELVPLNSEEVEEVLAEVE